MVFARWQNTIVDDAGNVLPLATVEVRSEVAGFPLATLYTDRDGATPAGNPVTADADGFAYFHVRGGAYRITATSGAFSKTWRYVAIGTAAEFDDGEGFIWRGEWDPYEAYSTVDVVSFEGSTFVCILTNIGETPPSYPTESNTYWEIWARRGAQGPFPGVEFNWDTGTTDADPGTGEVRINHATPASATFIYASVTSALGEDIEAYLASFDDADNTIKGTIELLSTDDTTKSIRYQVSGSVVDATTYYKIPVTFVSVGTGSFVAADPVSMLFVRSGDQGADGAGVPAGGAAGDILVKQSGTDGDLDWEHPRSIFTGGKEFPIKAMGMIALSGADGAVPYVAQAATNKTQIVGYSFNASTASYIEASFIAPSDLDLSEPFKVKLVWTNDDVAGTAAQVVAWFARAQWQRNDDAIDAAFGTAVEVDDAFIAAGDRHITDWSGDITPSGTAAANGMIVLQIYRDPTDGSDDYAQDAVLTDILFHYEVDKSPVEI